MFGRDASGRAILDGALVEDLLREAGAGTPTYLYDLDAIAGEARAIRAGYGDARHLVAYAVKASSAGRIVRTIAGEGCGADVVSVGELEVALGCGIAPADVVFSGVAKQDFEIDAAIGAGPEGIGAIQVESVEELGRVAVRARALGRRARVSIRVNPYVEADTHAHVATGHDAAKFGVAREDLGDAFAAVRSHAELRLVGVSSHVGSQLVSTEPYVRAARILLDVVREAEAAVGPLEYVDFGGGFGIDYGSGCPARPADFAREAVRLVREAGLERLRIVAEPGRSLVAAHGILVAAVVQTKASRSGRRWLMIDAGMNDLVRPALYQARHRIEPLVVDPSARGVAYRVVGPICESSDDFGSYELPDPAPAMVVIRDAGAYGFAMASQYNGRPLPAEVFVKGGHVVGTSARGSREAWVRGRLAT
jgi:diaminopimelate decarboxylase